MMKATPTTRRALLGTVLAVGTLGASGCVPLLIGGGATGAVLVAEEFLPASVPAVSLSDPESQAHNPAPISQSATIKTLLLIKNFFQKYLSMTSISLQRRT